mgnify:CR=1 FL=1
MMKKTFLPALFVLLAFTFSSVAIAQEAKKEEGKKEEKVLKSVTCDPACGFKVRSHDEAELSGIVKEHAKKVHNMDMSDAQIKGMMKTEKMAKKKAEKMEKKM